MTPDNPPDREVDYRFILANERTFLAWLRSGLALVAGGVALDQFVTVSAGSIVVRIVAIGTIALGAVVAGVGTVRWSQVESAMRTGRPMPRTRVTIYLGVVFVLLAIAIGLILLLAL